MIFLLSRGEREAVYAALCEVDRYCYPQAYRLKNRIDTHDVRTLEVEMSGDEVEAVLQNLQNALDAISRSDSSDWSRYPVYERARRTLIQQTRKQFGVVPDDDGPDAA